MSLRTATMIALATMLAVALVVQQGIYRSVIRRSFLDLEAVDAAEDLDRVQAALDRERDHLSAFTFDWSAWDDAYEYVETQSPAFAEANLGDDTFKNYHFDVMAFFRADGTLVWGRALEHRGETAHEVALPTLLRDHPAVPILTHGPVDEAIAGLVHIDDHSLLLAARPIIRSSYTGPSRGTLVVGRFVADEFTRELAAQVGLHLRLLPITAAPPAGTVASAPVLNRVDDQQLVASTTYPQLDGTPGLIVEASLPRRIWARSQATERFGSLFLLAASASVFALILVLLRRIVLVPLEQLAARVREVATTRDLRRPVVIDRDDEIGQLSRQFQHMTDELRQAQDQLVAQSYRSGMAEIAVGALHNLGNALQPVSATAHILGESIAAASPAHLRTALDELDGQGGDPERRERLNLYVRGAARGLLDESARWPALVDRILEQTAYASQIVEAQARHRDAKPVLQELDVRELVDDCVRLLPSDQVADVQIHVARGAEVPPVLAERTRLLQVLQNLLINAVESVRASAGPRRVEIDVRAADDARHTVRVAVVDTGIGFAEADTTALFRAGNSRKPGVGRGFGLHWSAAAVATMGGTLRAHSDGPGRGATFELEFQGAAPGGSVG